MNTPVENAVTQTPEAAFQLGELTVDPRAGEARGPGGREKLDPKVMDVLVVLAQHAGQVVLREELLARLWPNVVVTDEVLSRCIYELRRQLSQAGGSERYKEMIETIPKRGYRLIGNVIPAPDPPSTRPPLRPKWRLPVLIAAATAVALFLIVVGQRVTDSPADPHPLPAASAINSIAVLPFVDMSPGKDQGYLADGISEEILNRLAQAENLRVIARTSSFALRDPTLAVAEIAKRLNVTHVLEGSVRKSDNQIRITAQLIAASDSSHVWSETFDRGLGDLFAVQDEIAAAVTTALATTLSRSSPESRPPSNFEAHEKFLQGEFFYYRRSPGDLERSVQNFEAAVALDPGNARSWASLAKAYSMLARETDPPVKSLQVKQGQAAKRAVELDPNLAMAHIRLAEFLEHTGNREQAEEHLQRAKTLDPDDPFFLGHSIQQAIERGDFATAIAIQHRIVARDPLAAVVRGDLAVFLLADGQLDEALSQFRSVQAIHPNTDPNVAIDIVHVLILQGRYDEARLEMALVPEGSQREQGWALLHAATGNTEEADAALKRLLTESDDIMDIVRLAEVYAFRDMSDQAFEVLQGRKTAFERAHGSESGHVWYLQFESRISPFLKSLHSDPRWSKFVAVPG